MDINQLNPDAAEFVPVSPERKTPLSSFGNRPDLLEDDVVAQSPRKGLAAPMDDITLPLENDFTEISQRPAELIESPTAPTFNANGLSPWQGEHRPGSSSSQCSYQEMNMKEAMHGDEKQEFAADASNDALNEEPVEVFSEQRVNRESDPMERSFYNDGSNQLQNNPFNSTGIEVDMNAVRMLPSDSDDELANGVTEEKAVTENQPETEKPELVPFEDELYQAKDTEVAAPIESDTPVAGMFEQQQSHEAQQHPEPEPEPTPISRIVHEMTTEVTSVLDEFDDNFHKAETHQTETVSFEHNQSDEAKTHELSGEHDLLNHSQSSVEEYELQPRILAFESNHQAKDSSLDDSYVSETNTSTPIAGVLNQEPKEEAINVESEPVLIDVQPEQNESETSPLIAAAAGVAAATAVAAAAITAAKSPSTKSVAKTTDAKKPSTITAKKTTSTTAATKTALKPLTAASTRPATAARSPTKPLASKAAPAAAKPTNSVAAARAAALARPTVEKKTTTTTTSTAARKPLTNGVATTTAVKKTTSTVMKSATSTAAAKPTAARPTSASAKSSATTTSKTSTMAPRVPLGAR